MPVTDKEKVLVKLKKLLALSRSDNPHEASLALQRVQKLMQAYGITRDDIALSDIDESISSYWAAGSINPPRYMLGLLGIIQAAFGVDSIIHSGHKPSVSFYGNKDRIELASYTWDVLARQLIAARKSYIGQQNKRIKSTTKTSRGDKFAEGWVLAVRSEVQLFAMTREERELASLWLEQKYPDSSKTSGRGAGKSRDADMSRHHGYREGEHVRLHQPVSGQEQRKLRSDL
ncbi:MULTISPECIES: DUF2786 domain-containing protein [unclassified Enterobacter]|uniref:DUF2786 domain-containing protein n=1 Tax=unclassified Enterobacter TaxID=2608935 RepID=UPI0021481740|nr:MULTISPECIES: DUF2786 domain-containing protein [unclassified Enterobacter]MCR1304498.1 DUF2786 domain-containing protein [Enterobacter sp. FL1277]MCR1309486.1 DUF2786 domain-containing protein [Enterobacter sp. BT1271]MCR1311611.1 DUF2786 domain-containing protein [Enterobacter sp. BT855]MCR1321789.1 DUF2786 domain-containing protein [Enterobacter sp. BT1268]MCR1327045.1 DUF2786 domain-containing protein [Enterobacter sp. BT1131]